MEQAEIQHLMQRVEATRGLLTVDQFIRHWAVHSPEQLAIDADDLHVDSLRLEEPGC